MEEKNVIYTIDKTIENLKRRTDSQLDLIRIDKTHFYFILQALNETKLSITDDLNNSKIGKAVVKLICEMTESNYLQICKKENVNAEEFPMAFLFRSIKIIFLSERFKRSKMKELA